MRRIPGTDCTFSHCVRFCGACIAWLCVRRSLLVLRNVQIGQMADGFKERSESERVSEGKRERERDSERESARERDSE